MSGAALLRVPVFPLAGALLFPRSQLPLHIFEPRYRAMTRDAMAGDRLIAMVQPRNDAEPPALFEVGCLGRIGTCEELDDENLVNGIAQIAPLDVGSKQALLEAADLADRADLLVQFMQFQRMAPGGADGPETLQ